MSGRSLSARLVIVGVLLASLLPQNIAEAHTVMTATREARGESVDISGASGPWSFTILDVQGKPAQAFLFIFQPDQDGDGRLDFAAGVGCHPRPDAVPNQTCEGMEIVPPGTYQLRLFLRGGPPEPPAAITIEVNHP